MSGSGGGNRASTQTSRDSRRADQSADGTLVSDAARLDSSGSPRTMALAVSAATDVAEMASIDHRIAPMTSPTTRSRVGIAMAISVVTSPRSSRDDRQSTADDVGQKVLHGIALEYDGEQPSKARGGDRRDGIFGGGGTAFRDICFEWSKCSVHALRMPTSRNPRRLIRQPVDRWWLRATVGDDSHPVMRGSPKSRVEYRRDREDKPSVKRHDRHRSGSRVER
ncbi:MAG: hypothetical protein RL378_769 [Actinomycetota bacterium]